MNWLTGVALLVLTLGMAFTGQLAALGSGCLLGGRRRRGAGRPSSVDRRHLGAPRRRRADRRRGTLTRFYATHVFLLPALIFIFVGVHLYLVVRHGISEPPGRGSRSIPRRMSKSTRSCIHKDGIPFWPDAAWRDVVFALAVGAVVLTLAVTIGPKELAAQADPDPDQGLPSAGLVFPLVLRHAGADADLGRTVRHRGRAVAGHDRAAGACRSSPTRRAQPVASTWTVAIVAASLF